MEVPVMNYSHRGDYLQNCTQTSAFSIILSTGGRKKTFLMKTFHISQAASNHFMDTWLICMKPTRCVRYDMQCTVAPASIQHTKERMKQIIYNAFNFLF